MSGLIDKLRAARLSTLTVDGRAYQIRRPTDADAAGLGELTALDLVRRFVAGWDHTELSLGIPGGTGAAAPFDAALWAEWVNDQPQLWGPISAAIIEAYRAHVAHREEQGKN